jgi:hypothetical protein
MIAVQYSHPLLLYISISQLERKNSANQSVNSSPIPETALLLPDPPPISLQTFNNRWNFDTSLKTHTGICNNKASFAVLNKGPAYETPIFYGTTNSATKGRGTVVIKVETPSGPGYMELTDVVFIPGFLINIVSIMKYLDRGYRWN